MFEYLQNYLAHLQQNFEVHVMKEHQWRESALHLPIWGPG